MTIKYLILTLLPIRGHSADLVASLTLMKLRLFTNGISTVSCYHKSNEVFGFIQSSSSFFSFVFLANPFSRKPNVLDIYSVNETINQIIVQCKYRIICLQEPGNLCMNVPLLVGGFWCKNSRKLQLPSFNDSSSYESQNLSPTPQIDASLLPRPQSCR